MRVFLGGTCNNSTWRDDLIPMLKIDYFNPVVGDWTPECQEIEILERKRCDFCLYVITSDMKGVYSIAELVADSFLRPDNTLFCFLPDGFDLPQIDSLEAVGDLVLGRGVPVFNDLESVAQYLNELA